MSEMPMEFVLTEDHLKLLRHAHVGWQDCETGAPEIDPKRPYGNSWVAGDVAEIVNAAWEGIDRDGGMPEEMEEQLLALHRETAVALQVILNVGTFEPGTYRNTHPHAPYGTLYTRVGA